MLAKLDLPEELLEALPADPFEQLDVACRITSIALSTRVDALESELSALRQELAQRENMIAGLESQLQSLEASLAEASDKLDAAHHEKESLMRENSQLSSKVKKLNQDVAKLEDNPSNAPKPSPQQQPNKNNAVKARASQGLLLAYQTSTPPPGSPPSLSASVSPSRTPKPLSPRRRSISFSTARSFKLDNNKSSVYSSSQFSSMSSVDSGSQSGKTRVDGKEFFRHVRSRLSYEQFAAFLANVKELNAMKQTKEETLLKADGIFGPDNKDLCVIFEGLIMRNVH